MKVISNAYCYILVHRCHRAKKVQGAVPKIAPVPLRLFGNLNLAQYVLGADIRPRVPFSLCIFRNFPKTVHGSPAENPYKDSGPLATSGSQTFGSEGRKLTRSVFAMEDEVEVIKSNKGGLKVIHKGYMYTVHKRRPCGGIRWRCAQRSRHCTGSISTAVDGTPKINMPHNHLPDMESVALARGRSDDFTSFSHLADVHFEEDSVVDKMADWSLPRKARKSNFSTSEVDVLVDAVRVHYNTLYGKYAKRVTNRWIRHKAWLDILKKVNGVSFEKRTLQEVKNKWKKCQYAMKERAVRGTLADDPDDSSFEDFIDSMPLQERLSKVAAQEKISGQVLKSQPLSPTKLKVTRQNAKLSRPVERPPSPVNEEMCLRWNSHHSNMQTAFPSILSKEQYVDVTLAAEGKTLKCHRLILSSCSPYFEEILSGISPLQHPVLFMRDIPFWILRSLCDFMYAGEVHIFQNKLQELLTVAEALKIKGLAGKSTPPDNHQNAPSQKPDTKPKKRPQPEKTQHQPPLAPKKKINIKYSKDYEDDLIDPLELLEPMYEEATEDKKPVFKPKEYKNQPQQPIKKPFARKLRKRKFSDQRDPSPPPVFTFRKGTRSRPNVKIPKYYHSDYSNPLKNNPNASDPLLDVDEIKTEPIDVEDNFIDYADAPIIITNVKATADDKNDKKELGKPVIAEVHTIEETNTTKGGLEVIKITLPVPRDPFQGIVIAGSKTVAENEPKETEINERSEQERARQDGGSERELLQEHDARKEQCELEHVENDSRNEQSTQEQDGKIECEVEHAQNSEQCQEHAPCAPEQIPQQEGASNSVEDGIPSRNNNSIEENEQEEFIYPQIQIKDVRSTCVDEGDEVRPASLDHLEKEAMNVVNVINVENQAAAAPDVE